MVCKLLTLFSESMHWIEINLYKYSSTSLNLFNFNLLLFLMIKLRTIKTCYSFYDNSSFFGFGSKIWNKLSLFIERTLRLTRSKIEIRLTLGYLPLVIAVVCISFISLKNLDTVNKINKSIIERDMVLLDAVDKMADHILSLES